MKRIFFNVCLAAIVFAGCKSNGTIVAPVEEKKPVTIPEAGAFAKGADISWITEQEAQNVKFYNSAGLQKDIYDILKEQGINTIRLRVWANPPDGWCSKADLLVKAKRAKAAGMRILVDFHYSDSWADPAKQTKPVAWASHDINALKTDVYNHTADVLNTLKDNGITPEWVQVGNETNDGMLWPEGKASTNMANFAALVQSGYNAVKSVSTDIKVIVHISNGYDNSLFRWMFDGLKANNVNYDVIGMSLYPTASNWQTLSSQCLTNMNDMVARYNKEIMIVEVGMEATAPTATKDFISGLINNVKTVNSGKGIGVMYWEPQAYNKWKGYALGAFDATGKPTVAMDAFK
jgi:arabinogalactan endo-1,4-beta-galactosidase